MKINDSAKIDWYEDYSGEGYNAINTKEKVEICSMDGNSVGIKVDGIYKHSVDCLDYKNGYTIDYNHIYQDLMSWCEAHSDEFTIGNIHAIKNRNANHIAALDTLENDSKSDMCKADLIEAIESHLTEREGLAGYKLVAFTNQYEVDNDGYGNTSKKGSFVVAQKLSDNSYVTWFFSDNSFEYGHYDMTYTEAMKDLSDRYDDANTQNIPLVITNKKEFENKHNDEYNVEKNNKRR